MNRRQSRLIIALLALVLGSLAYLAAERLPDGALPPEPRPGPETATATVVAVVDGDTIDVSLGGTVERVRYIGIDAPESAKPNEAPECFGKEASARNREYVHGKEVRLEKDVSERDRYGRLLRFVYVGDALVNQRLVAEGFATAYTYPPDVSRSGEFLEAQRSALGAKLGLWGGCRELPEPGTVESPSSPACAIKGNVSLSGERIFHAPGCEFYSRTRIDEPAGERWFCSEEEARAAGWRKAENCP